MKKKHSTRECIHGFWGCEFCNVCGVFITFLDFLITVVVITSFVIWIASADGIELHPDEKQEWEKQCNDSFIIFIISSTCLVLSIIINNCFLEKYSSWHNCCKDNSVYPDI